MPRATRARGSRRATAARSLTKAARRSPAPAPLDSASVRRPSESVVGEDMKGYLWPRHGRSAKRGPCSPRQGEWPAARLLLGEGTRACSGRARDPVAVAGATCCAFCYRPSPDGMRDTQSADAFLRVDRQACPQPGREGDMRPEEMRQPVKEEARRPNRRRASVLGERPGPGRRASGPPPTSIARSAATSLGEADG